MRSHTIASADIDDLVRVIEDSARMLVRVPSTEHLSLSSLAAMKTLEAYGPLRITDLAAAEQVTQPAMTQIVARLSREGIVARQAEPNDGRVVLVSITDVGRDISNRRRARRIEYLAGAFARLSPEDRDAIRQALPALTRFIGLRTGGRLTYQPTPSKELV